VHADELAKTIDHTLLKPDTVSADVERLCREAAKYHFAAVCVFPHFIPLADGLLRRADVKVCSVISFPFGADAAHTKVVAAEDAVARGADEVDVVINVPALLSGDFGLVRDELASASRPSTAGAARWSSRRSSRPVTSPSR
jgi:deoxyribose-phosphate aldolase